MNNDSDRHTGVEWRPPGIKTKERNGKSCNRGHQLRPSPAHRFKDTENKDNRCGSTVDAPFRVQGANDLCLFLLQFGLVSFLFFCGH